MGPRFRSLRHFVQARSAFFLFTHPERECPHVNDKYSNVYRELLKPTWRTNNKYV